MSSDSVFSSTPRTPKPQTKTTTTTSPPPLPSEHHRPLHKVKKEKKSTGSSSRSREKPEPPAPLSLRGQVFQVLAMALVAWVVATGGFKTVEWIQQQLKPFCNSYSTTKAEISEDCIPCPENGSCRDSILECFVGFKRFGKSCVKDKEIDQTAEKLVGYLTNHVCGLAARAICEGAPRAVRMTSELNNSSRWTMCRALFLKLCPSKELELTDDEAQAYLKEQGMQEQLNLDDKSWQLVWEKMARIAEDSIANLNDLDGKRAFSCPSELVQAYKPVRCRIREWIWANLFILVISSPAALLGTLFIINCIRRRNLYARAEEVYLQVCEALEERALECREMGQGEPWVVVSRLRDHILFPSERKWTALWRQIEGLVREDSRIDQYQKKVKGEMKIVWEWQVEGALRTPHVRKKILQDT